MLCEQCIRNTPMLKSEHHFNSSFHLFSYRARSSSFKLWLSFLEDIVTIFNKCIKTTLVSPFFLAFTCQVYMIQALQTLFTKQHTFKNQNFGILGAETVLQKVSFLVFDRRVLPVQLEHPLCCAADGCDCQ